MDFLLRNLFRDYSRHRERVNFILGALRVPEGHVEVNRPLHTTFWIFDAIQSERVYCYCNLGGYIICTFSYFSTHTTTFVHHHLRLNDPLGNLATSFTCS